MIYAKWLLFVVAGTLMDLAGLFVVPVAMMCVGDRYLRLPRWARWWDNDREPYGDLERLRELTNTNGNKWRWRYLRWHWLAVRNPSNNFGYNVIGFKQTENVVYGMTGNPNTSDQGEGGWRWIEAMDIVTGRVLAFEFYMIVPYGSRCLRMRLGWKLGHHMHPALRVTDGSPAQLANVINPFMPYRPRGKQ